MPLCARQAIIPAFFLALLGPVRALAGGEQLWRFYADFGVTVVEGVDDLSGNGGKDLLVGSEDDTLYLVEGRGANAGKQLWQKGFRSTLSVAALIGDVNGDGRGDVIGGDQEGLMQCISGATGGAIWANLTFGTVLSAIGIPDVDGDGKPEAVFGSENDTVYCVSSKSKGLGQSAWEFAIPNKKGHGGPGCPPICEKVVAKAAVGGRPKDAESGANALALLRGNGNAPHGIAVGTNNDTVYCLPPGGGAPKWKTGLPGDVWKIAAFPDQDGDGIEEVLLACGADAGYLLKGSNGDVLWSHAVRMGGVSVAASPDATGDGKADALIGDGGGQVHCVPGNAQGSNVPAAWTYDFGDTSTILAIVPLGDLDADGRSETAVGTSNDEAAVIDGKGGKGWLINMGGAVTSIANLGDADGNGAADVAAGTEMGYVSLLSGAGVPTISVGPGAGREGLCLARCVRGGVGAAGASWDISLIRPAHLSLRIFDGSGRLVASPLSGRFPAGRRRVDWKGPKSAGSYLARLSADGQPVSIAEIPVAGK